MPGETQNEGAASTVVPRLGLIGQLGMEVPPSLLDFIDDHPVDWTWNQLPTTNFNRAYYLPSRIAHDVFQNWL
jgi:hypothetical protein